MTEEVNQTGSSSARFYDNLTVGNEKRGMWGMDRRFNADRVSQRNSTKRYFLDVVTPLIKKSDRVLDFGCGPGTFLTLVAPLCKEIVGVDISSKFVSECQNLITKSNIPNAKTQLVSDVGELNFEANSFDKIILIDVIHHLDHPVERLQSVLKVLKPGGEVLIYEPNKLNPLMAVMHYLDKNERGLLKLGSPKKYRQLLGPFLRIDILEFNGIVIGPESKAFDIVADLINSKLLKPFLSWLNPKIFIKATKI